MKEPFRRDSDCRLRLAWEGYVKATCGTDEPPEFVAIQQGAFYAGAVAIVDSILSGSTPRRGSEILRSIVRELMADECGALLIRGFTATNGSGPESVRQALGLRESERLKVHTEEPK